MSSERTVTVEEIRRHANSDDCWLVIDNTVWDLTEFAPQHPGGAVSELNRNIIGDVILMIASNYQIRRPRRF